MAKARKIVKASNEETLAPITTGIVQHTGKEPYADVRAKVIEAKNIIDDARWSLASALYDVNESSLYVHWGFPSWDSYVDTEVGLKGRTAQYLTSMYHWFAVVISDRMTPEEKEKLFAAVRKLGWTKASALVSIATSDDVYDWIEKAEAMTAIQLTTETRRILADRAGEAKEDVPDVVKKQFKFTLDQAEIVDQAVEKAQGITGTDSAGSSFAFICQDYLASSIQSDNGSNQAKLRGKYLDRIGAMLGIRIVAIDPEASKVVHGTSYLKQIGIVS